MLLENSFYPMDSRVRQESQALASAGYQVTVISPGQRGQHTKETIDGVVVYRFPAPSEANGVAAYLWEYGYSMTATFIMSVWVLLHEGFDVIHAANPPDTFVLIAAPYKLLGKRFVYDHHDLAPEMYFARFGGHGNRFLHWILVMLEKLSCRLADRIIATNQSYKTIEIQRSGVAPNRITIVRNGPDVDWLRPLEQGSELRSRGKHIIGYAGIMGFQDGVDHLIRALKHLLVDLGRTDFYCVLVGGYGDARASLIALTTELGLDDYVGFTGWVSDADYIRYLSTSDICVDPDPSNSFNDRSTMGKIMEYMALGKPIVAFDLPEHRASAQGAALYVRPNDELEFARAIERLMDEPARREAMGALGKHRVETELAWRFSIPHLLDAYQALTGGTGAESLPLSAIDGGRIEMG